MNQYERSLLPAAFAAKAGIRLIVVSLTLVVSRAQIPEGFVGPSEYLCFDSAASASVGDCSGKDSPFKDLDFVYFHLEDFEAPDFANPIRTPGVLATAVCAGRNPPSGNCPFIATEIFPARASDSVDEDDGAIDGLGQTVSGRGYSAWATGDHGILLEFDELELGTLPTHVGVVWTDGAGVTSFEAFDAQGNSLGITSANHADGTFEGTTADDRFYGFVHLDGLSAVRISNSIGGIEIDHLQYGRFVAELTVAIDVKPGSDPNCFNINGHGVVPVAVLGSPELDVESIDIESLRFAGLEVRVRGNGSPQCSVEFSNSDEFADLVCQFVDEPEAWAPGEAEGTLVGALIDGPAIRGTDSICVVP